ncbi:MAG: acyl-protein synthetase [Epsilonproteobacteria bacterium]|nr:acyl-protein synthetase [Campylobacterota bacterium]
MKYIDKLFKVEDALNHTKQSNQLFFEAMREAYLYHYKNNKVYKNICDNENFDIKSVKSYDDLYKIPHIIVDAFKWHDLLSIDKSKIVATFSSSGTSGQKSHISWDEASKQRQNQMRANIIKSYGLLSKNAVNYLIFAYSPRVSEGKGAAHAHQMYSTFAPANKKFFAIDADENGKAFFSEKSSVKHFEEFAKDDVALRIIGFPAFIYDTLLHMKKENIKFNFAKQSLIIIAGGWKSAQNRAISFDEFCSLTEEFLGINSTQIRDVYGFVEHGVPYITCKYNHFHVPIYSKAYTRKPGTLEVLPNGEKGLLHVLSPYNYAQPSLSILATDYAIIHSNCPCGIEGDYIELRGRAGLKKHEGCAISATELLKETKRKDEGQ